MGGGGGDTLCATRGEVYKIQNKKSTAHADELSKCVLYTHNTKAAVQNVQEHHGRAWAFLSLTPSALQCVYNAGGVKTPVVIVPIQGCALLLVEHEKGPFYRHPLENVLITAMDGEHEWDTHRVFFFLHRFYLVHYLAATPLIFLNSRKHLSRDGASSVSLHWPPST
jgi:hypothetical protein